MCVCITKKKKKNIKQNESHRRASFNQIVFQQFQLIYIFLYPSALLETDNQIPEMISSSLYTTLLVKFICILYKIIILCNCLAKSNSSRKTFAAGETFKESEKS